MKRVGSIKEILDIALELPAGAVPYEEFDFEPYFEEAENEQELRKTWRVFTKVKDVLDNGLRLENASWRLWFRERSKTGIPPTDIIPPASLDKQLLEAGRETDRIVGDMFSGVGERFQEENAKSVEIARAERTRSLLELAKKHQIDEAVVDDILSWVQKTIIESDEVLVDKSANLLPENAVDAKNYIDKTVFMPRPRVAAFSHSLERNGANNFLLYLVRELREILSFELYSPKEGAMRADYESMGIPVKICSMKLVSYPEDVRVILRTFQYAIANTIMTTEVINACSDLKVPCLWVIHEAWPKSQFNFYAKEVFMMTHLNEEVICDAFTNASKIVFPAEVQRRCYEGLFSPKNARVIYNGIPLASINAFRTVQNRDKVREELGYSPNDFLLVHMGTVCKRKAQLVTCQSFAELYSNGPLPDGKQFKLLMVGARYIRQHEIEYIEECKQTLEAVGAEDSATILDVKKNVLPYYLAADIVLCPSVNEVLPLVICEAMAFERPVIASRIDGIPEALDDGIEGFLIPPSNPMALTDAIEKLAVDDELRKTMGANGRKRVLSQFSFKTMSKTYRETISVDLDLKLSKVGPLAVAS